MWGLLIIINNNLNVCTKDGRTPLHIAIGNNYINCLEVLLSNGAEVNTKMNVNNQYNLYLRFFFVINIDKRVGGGACI